MPGDVSPYPECYMVIIWSKFWLIIQKMIKDKLHYFFNLISLLLMIFYVNTYLEGLQELSYFILFITGEVSMNYWKVTDKAGPAISENVCF